MGTNSRPESAVQDDMQPMGWIYFVYCNGMLKIGQTKVPAPKRLSALQTGCPYPLELAATWRMEAKFLTKAERFLHDRFKDRAVLGEWFAVAPDSLALAREALVEHLKSVADVLPPTAHRRRRYVPKVEPFDMMEAVRAHVGSEFHKHVLKSAAMTRRFEIAELRRSLNNDALRGLDLRDEIQSSPATTSR